MTARLLWILPLILLFICLSLVRSGLDVRRTLLNGETVKADVIEYDVRSRAEITYGHVKVRATANDGSTIEEVVPLPLSLLYSLEEKQQLDVRILPGSRRPVIIEEVGRAQWKLALINSGMALFGFILLVIGVGGWNLYLRRHGDPSAAIPVEGAAA